MVGIPRSSFVSKRHRELSSPRRQHRVQGQYSDTRHTVCISQSDATPCSQSTTLAGDPQPGLQSEYGYMIKTEPEDVEQDVEYSEFCTENEEWSYEPSQNFTETISVDKMNMGIMTKNYDTDISTRNSTGKPISTSPIVFCGK